MKKVLLVNWDCYPNCASGGVYTWTKALIDSLSDWEFVVINQLSNPSCNRDYTIPKHVIKVIEMPIFGSNRYDEFYDENKAFIPKIMRTTESVIRQKFLPLYEEFLANILSDRCDHKDLSELIFKLHKFLTVYDSKKCFEHYLTWQIFLKQINTDPLYQQMTLKEALTAFQLLQRNMQILSIEIPKVDIIHCSLAWLPSMTAIFAKMENNCPVIITEHGVAFRELLLFYNAYMFDEPSKIFWKVFSRNVVKTVYSLADVITPVCLANAGWEESLGADPLKIKVIYNGVNTKKFRPLEIKREDSRPTVVSVGRIEPFKDIVCLIQAIKHAKEHVPNIQCLIYGGATDLEYSLKCVDAVKNLQLEDNVKFMGTTKEPEKAYNLADVVAVSSITEGFPFAIIEAMSCGKAVVASDVGGVREALEGSGLLVQSRRPDELAKAIVTLLKDEKLRNDLGAVAAKRVKDEFTLEKSVNQFREQYEALLKSYDKNEQKTSLIEKVVAQ